MEQIIIEALYYILRDFYQVFWIFFCQSLMLTPKYNKWLTIFGSAFVSWLFEVFVDSSFTAARTICFFLTLMLPGILFYKEKKSMCFFAFALQLVTMLVLDITASTISYVIYGTFLTSEGLAHTWNTIIYVIGTDILFTGGFLLLPILWNRFIKKESSRSMGLFVLFPLSQFVFFCACSYQTWTVAQLDLLNNPFIVAAFALSILADIAMYRALVQNSRVQQLSRSCLKD